MLDDTRKESKEIRAQSQMRNDAYYNARRKNAPEFTERDYVTAKNFNSTAGIARKLISKNEGTFVIERILKNDRYLIKDFDGFQLSRNPYQCVRSGNNIRHWLKE